MTFWRSMAFFQIPKGKIWGTHFHIAAPFVTDWLSLFWIQIVFYPWFLWNICGIIYGKMWVLFTAVFPCGNFGGSSVLSKATLERWGFPKKSPQRCFACQQNKGESPIRGAFVGQTSCLGLICFKRLDCLGFFEGNPLFEYCPPCPDVSYTGLGQKWANVSCTSEVIGHWWQFPSQWFSQWQFSTSLQCSPWTLFHWPCSLVFIDLSAWVCQLTGYAAMPLICDFWGMIHWNRCFLKTVFCIRPLDLLEAGRKRSGGFLFLHGQVMQIWWRHSNGVS